MLRQKLAPKRWQKKQPQPQPTENLQQKKIFRVPFLESVANSDPFGLVPLPIREATTFLQERGLQEEGLFRIPGNLATVNSYISRYDSGEKGIFSEEREPANAASLIIKYLQYLPDSLLTDELEAEFYSLPEIPENQKLQKLGGLLIQLPPPNRETLRLLFQLWVELARHSDQNKMTSRNIGLSLGEGYSKFTQILIDNFEDVFPPETIVFSVSPQNLLQNSQKLDGVRSFGPFSWIIEWIEADERRLTEEFIYGQTISPERMNHLVYSFNIGERDVGFVDSIEASAVLKFFLFHLPSGLFPWHLDSFVSLSNQWSGGSREEIREAARRLIQDYPNEYQQLIFQLVTHWRLVSRYSDRNKMRLEALFATLGDRWRQAIFLFHIVAEDDQNC